MSAQQLVPGGAGPLPAAWPGSLREINDLPEPTKLAIYYTLLPDWPFERFAIDRETMSVDGKPVVSMHCPPGSRSLELTLIHRADAQDPLVYLHMVDTFNYQLMVLLLVVNDPESPRFDVDVNEYGRSTNLGTTSRNIPEEIRAMEYGLAPGQVRAGLRVFRQGVPVFESFVHNMGKDLFLIEPLAYHNAITFERYGFAYIRGRTEMEAIHARFQPGGDLHARLDASTPFRKPDAWQTIRGRSWAIHDGILDHPFTGFQMYKRIGHGAGVTTFPDAAW